MLVLYRNYVTIKIFVDAERTTSSTARYTITLQVTSRADAFIHSFRSISRMQYAARNQAWEQLYGKLMAGFQTQTIKMAIF
jgi:hypothetical protein